MTPADLAESMVPVACDLACRVRDGDADGIARLAEAHGWDRETSALLVVLAAMVPVEDASPNDLLAWTGGLEMAVEWRQEPLPGTECRCRELEPCGTYAAWARHKRHGEPVDVACERAYQEYKQPRNREAWVRYKARQEAAARESSRAA